MSRISLDPSYVLRLTHCAVDFRMLLLGEDRIHMKLSLNMGIWIPFVISVAVVAWNEFVVPPGERYPFLSTLPFLFTGVVFSRVLAELRKRDT
ncbi:MAG: hypothetical protein DCC68_06775 [Planctomycetota bacterium]|nr:MAG: hypothetical protein DCC68_06775 [Planctomycetota bacterium]